MARKNIPSQTVKKIRKESEELRREVRRRTVTYITAALGLVVGLAWNEAIKSVIEYLFPLSQNTMAAKITYAAVITIVLVLVTAYLFKEPKEQKKK